MLRGQLEVKVSATASFHIYRAYQTGDICFHLWERERGTGVWRSTPKILYANFDSIDDLISALENARNLPQPSNNEQVKDEIGG